jgi:Leucine-rich repeat (LRR) protein
LPHLTRIGLFADGYNLSGTFPKQISKLSNLSILSLRDNNLSGRLPSQLWELSSLRVLRMNGNGLTGGWPSSWSLLTSLSFIDVGHNSLTGPLPDLNLFPFSNIENLWVDHNRFSGTIPKDLSSGHKLSKCIALEWLSTVTNRCIAVVFAHQGLHNVTFALSLLEQVFLHENNLVGSLPNIGNLTSLEYFDVSGNMITGSLPSEIGLLTKLRDLVISSTYLHGTIPKELYGLSNLQDVILSRCNFTGTVSERIGELTQLERLMLDGNSFFGALPKELGLLSSLIHVELQDNEFVGTVPNSMCRLKGPHTLTVLITDCAPTTTSTGKNDSEGKVLESSRVSCPDDCCSSCCDPGTLICVPN